MRAAGSRAYLSLQSQAALSLDSVGDRATHLGGPGVMVGLEVNPRVMEGLGVNLRVMGRAGGESTSPRA